MVGWVSMDICPWRVSAALLPAAVMSMSSCKLWARESHLAALAFSPNCWGSIKDIFKKDCPDFWLLKFQAVDFSGFS